MGRGRREARAREWQGRGARVGNRGGIARAGTPQAPAAPIERDGKRGEGGREEGGEDRLGDRRSQGVGQKNLW